MFSELSRTVWGGLGQSLVGDGWEILRFAQNDIRGAKDDIGGAQDDIVGAHDEIGGTHDEIGGTHDEIGERRMEDVGGFVEGLGYVTEIPDRGRG